MVFHGRWTYFEANIATEAESQDEACDNDDDRGVAGEVNK